MILQRLAAADPSKSAARDEATASSGWGTYCCNPARSGSVSAAPPRTLSSARCRFFNRCSKGNSGLPKRPRQCERLRSA
jgi:hypothetical protein